MTAQRAKIYELVLLNKIFVLLFWSSFGSFFFFWFFLVEYYPLLLIFKLIRRSNIFNFESQFRSIFRTLSNIQDRGFCTNSERLLVFDYFCKKPHLRCLIRFWVRLWSQLRLCGKSSISNDWQFASNYL